MKYKDLQFYAKELMSYEDINELKRQFYFDVQQIINYFVDENYIRIIENKIVISDKLKKEVDVKTSVDEVDKWIDEWKELFPSGNNPFTNKPFKGSSSERLKRMKKFVKDHPDVTKDEIFQATRNYVKKHYKGSYIRQAHFFIEKDKNGSDLEAEIELLRDGKGEQSEDPNWG